MTWKPSRELVEFTLNQAIDTFYTRDSTLIDRNANERSITHRLAFYLELIIHMSDWRLPIHVDCEFNRAPNLENNRPKKWEHDIPDVPIDSTKGKTAYPDIIIHRRIETNHPGAQYVMIEAKTAFNADPDSLREDWDKLDAFRDNREYKYLFSVQIIFGQTREQTMIHWQRPL